VCARPRSPAPNIANSALPIVQCSASLFGAGLLGLAHTWPSVNRWTHGTLITAMHGHSAFYGAYAMIVLAMITYALPSLTRSRIPGESYVGYAAFWLQIAGMFGMTMSFATAGVAQVYLERIVGLGYLDTQLKIQVHFLMLILTASIFAIGVGLFIYDFFRRVPRIEAASDEQEITVPSGGADKLVPGTAFTERGA
jgi:nitric oxide reductase subunit B